MLNLPQLLTGIFIGVMVYVALIEPLVIYRLKQKDRQENP